MVGRRSEISYGDAPETYLDYRKNSAEAFENYCRQDGKGLFTEKEILEFKEYLYHPRKEKNPILAVMNISHELEMLRLRKRNEVTKTVNEFVNDAISVDELTPLLDYAEKCLKATGVDYDKGYFEFNDAIFVKCSKEVNECLKHLRAVDAPQIGSKPKSGPTS